ncbi:hypothetical protein AJ79_05696 [Helicocarpus griseus UAMH5409]|uniref:Uncharacterized protein n=1 Tax=Helicocarpus griseus UAMH5409 TaxID=1447875 RepID=A0A2B7XCK7_9EURO|nr:hypothetical protein AJ79_05696 [Helicocarpus griseus UAMH5409]
MRSEIATMKAVTLKIGIFAEKTTIPIPQLYAYSLDSKSILGLPYMLLEYVKGNILFGVQLEKLEQEKRELKYSQLADVYIQLHQQQFDRIGAFTLDDDGHWIFADNRPLTADTMSNRSVALIYVAIYLQIRPSHRQSITSIISRNCSSMTYHVRDSVMNEDDARHYLYSIYASRGLWMEWAKPEYDHGPFILIHGDLRQPNIVSILDWEWSHNCACTDQATQATFQDTMIAHVLLKPHYFGSVYWLALDSHFHGSDGEKRVQDFFQLSIRKTELQKLKQKALGLEQFEKERKELGVEAKITLKNQTRTPEEEAELVAQLKELRDIGEQGNRMISLTSPKPK